MKVIRMLSDMVEDTLDCAEKYIEAAIENKIEYPEVSSTLLSLSEIEMKSMSMLHTVVTKIIADYRKTNGEPPEPMMAVYEYLHKRHIDHASRIKAMQAMYKE